MKTEITLESEKQMATVCQIDDQFLSLPLYFASILWSSSNEQFNISLTLFTVGRTGSHWVTNSIDIVFDLLIIVEKREKSFVRSE